MKDRGPAYIGGITVRSYVYAAIGWSFLLAAAFVFSFDDRATIGDRYFGSRVWLKYSTTHVTVVVLVAFTFWARLNRRWYFAVVTILGLLQIGLWLRV